MEKRNKGWRAQQRKLHYVRRLKYYSNSASFWYVLALWPNSRTIKNSKGELNFHPNWKDLYHHNWCSALRTTGKPCSCWMCSPNKYKRKDFKKETRMLIKLEFESEFQTFKKKVKV